MSVYEFERNIYPDLNPTTPQEPHTYRLNKLCKTEAYFFLMKLKFVNKMPKK